MVIFILVTSAPPAVEEDVKDKTLPKAFVKPQMLTHVIDGQTILEGRK